MPQGSSPRQVLALIRLCEASARSSTICLYASMSCQLRLFPLLHWSRYRSKVHTIRVRYLMFLCDVNKYPYIYILRHIIIWYMYYICVVCFALTSEDWGRVSPSWSRGITLRLPTMPRMKYLVRKCRKGLLFYKECFIWKVERILKISIYFFSLPLFVNIGSRILVSANESPLQDLNTRDQRRMNWKEEFITNLGGTRERKKERKKGIQKDPFKAVSCASSNMFFCITVIHILKT